eukprot:6193081-Pleurochrysis_carterae.AAC.2
MKMQMLVRSYEEQCLVLSPENGTRNTLRADDCLPEARVDLPLSQQPCKETLRRLRRRSFGAQRAPLPNDPEPTTKSVDAGCASTPRQACHLCCRQIYASKLSSRDV